MPTKSSQTSLFGMVLRGQARWPQQKGPLRLPRTSEKRYFPHRLGVIRGISVQNQAVTPKDEIGLHSLGEIVMKLSASFCIGALTSVLLPVCSASAATEKVIYSFCSQQPNCADGAQPVAGLLRVKEELYATTSNRVYYDGGTVVAINIRTGAARLVYSFGNPSDASDPVAAPITVNGALYGTSDEGGNDGYIPGFGTIYSLNPKKGEEKVRYSFCTQQNCPDGEYPAASLLNVNGVLYGTTTYGGSNIAGCDNTTGCGTVFSFDPATGAERVAYSFCSLQSCADGGRPAGSLIDVNGKLYGTASEGGSGSSCNDMGLGCGTVFGLDPTNGAVTVLHTFAGGSLDGGEPLAGLLNVNGTLYGTTEYGGGKAYCSGYPDGEGCGTIFSIDLATGTEKLVYAFSNDSTDGQYPYAGLIQVKGKLYGTTYGGGVYGYGTAFSLDLSTGRESVLYSFCSQPNCSDGARPSDSLIEVSGTLYGTTQQGGANGDGAVFSLKS
jgi:uncharacterized repeat protein (TIGR03803 family)